MLAKLGHITACNELGLLYQEEGTSLNNFSKAAQWFEKTRQLSKQETPLNANYSYASFNLGLLYVKGKLGTLKKDKEKGIAILKQASDSGHKEAPGFIGMYYITEVKEKNSKIKGVEYLKLSCDRGSGFAKQTLQKLSGDPEIRIILKILDVKNTPKNAPITVINNAKGKVNTFTLDNKKIIKDTILIRLLKRKSNLSFFGVCDEQYEVDAVVRMCNDINDIQYKSALEFQKILKGRGFFAEGKNEKWFVLKGINTNEEGEGCMGHFIQRCLN